MIGILNCLKPAGMTSRDVVNVIARQLRPAKVGHAGTLDPLAHGVLLLAVGSGSRLVPYLHLYPKTYEATFSLGRSSPSGDLEFEPTEHPGLAQPSVEEVIAAAQRLTGRIEQTPPLYSAVKVGGKRAYTAARADQTLVIPSRRVEVHRFEILHYEYPLVRTLIACGSGTYIRSLGIDLAESCGTRAVMTDLRRTAIGPFAIEDSHPLEKLREHPLEPLLCPPRQATGMLTELQMTPAELVEVVHGRTIRHGWSPAPSDLDTDSPSPADAAVSADFAGAADSDAAAQHARPGVNPAAGCLADELAAIDPDGHLRALLIPRDGGWGPKRVFPRPDQPAPLS